MTTYQKYHHFLPFSLIIIIIIFHFQTLLAQPISSFSLQNLFNPNKDPIFDSSFSLLGDAQISNEGSFVNLTSPRSKNSGQIIYKKPLKFLDPRSLKPTISFSTDFTFTISPDNGGDGLAFVIFQSDNNNNNNNNSDFSEVFNEGYFGVSNDLDGNFIAVEFDTRKDDNVGDINGNHVGVNVGSFMSIDASDIYSIGLVLNGGKPLRSWIDYEANSRRIEVRLGEAGGERPYKPLISSAVDLGRMWGDKDVLVGISSSNANSMQVSSLHSWSFSVRSVSGSLHSRPLNPNGGGGGGDGGGVDREEEKQYDVREKSYFLTVLGTLIFATGCGTLGAFVVLFLWVVLYGRHSNVVPELPMSSSSVDFKYEKVNVSIENASYDATS